MGIGLVAGRIARSGATCGRIEPRLPRALAQPRRQLTRKVKDLRQEKVHKGRAAAADGTAIRRARRGLTQLADKGMRQVREMDAVKAAAVATKIRANHRRLPRPRQPAKNFSEREFERPRSNPGPLFSE